MKLQVKAKMWPLVSILAAAIVGVLANRNGVIRLSSRHQPKGK